MATAATYKRVMLEFAGVKCYPIEARYSLSRAANQVGRRIGDSMATRAWCYFDAHDKSRLSQDDFVKLWKRAVDPKDDPQKVSITWYEEDGDRVLCNAEFNGWISVFETYNPNLTGAGAGANTGGEGFGGQTVHSQSGYNNLLYVELVACIDEPNVSAHKMTK